MMNAATISARIGLVAFALASAALLLHSPVAARSAEPAGNVARGQAIFDGKGNCLSCHRVADQGSYMGPDLSAIGSNRKPEDLKKSLLEPSAQVAPQNRLYRVVTKDGKTITGRLLNQDSYIVQLLTSDARLLTLKKTSLRSSNFADTPPMPSYRDKLTAAEQDDLVAYLFSLQGVVKQ